MATISTIQFKRGSKASLTRVLVGQDNCLLKGEPAYESDTGKMKIGDGVSDYAALPYIGEHDTPTPAESGVVFSSFYDFPSLGNAAKLYVTTDSTINRIYRWDDVKKCYKVVSLDSEQFSSLVTDGDEVYMERQIDGGGATADYEIIGTRKAII